ncbi:MAG: tetratricopeptide repeat protein [Pseudonocardia sp.]
MSDLEWQLKEVVTRLDHLQRDPFGDQAARITRSIEASSLPDGIRGVGSTVARLVQVCDWALPMIAAELAQNSRLLSELIEVTSNPRLVAARESARHGVRAMENEWFAEAIGEFDRALAKYRYDPVVHFYLGVCRANLGDDHAALQAFELAVKYGFDKENQPAGGQVACGAAIVAAEAYCLAGDPAAAVRILDKVREKITDCPEVEHSYAHVTGDAAALRSALRIAPELALDARRRGTPHVEEVSVELLPVVQERLARGQQLTDRLNAVGATFDRTGIDEPIEPVVGRGAAWELATTSGSLHEVRGALAQTSHRVREVMDRRRRSIAARASSAEATRTSARMDRPKEVFLVVAGVALGGIILLVLLGVIGFFLDGIWVGGLIFLVIFVYGAIWFGVGVKEWQNVRGTGRRIRESRVEFGQFEREMAAHDRKAARYEGIRSSVEAFLNEPRPHRTIPFYGSVDVDAEPRMIEGGRGPGIVIPPAT